jgi:hypothetical protein
MYCSDTDELGMGGANYAWDSISQTKKLGYLKLIGDGEMGVSWFGFYDDVSKTYFLHDAPVFEGDENKNLLRC